jgi:hypothetical protein
VKDPRLPTSAAQPSRLWSPSATSPSSRSPNASRSPRTRPNPDNRAIYDELFEEFVNIYQNNKKAFARLNARH